MNKEKNIRAGLFGIGIVCGLVISLETSYFLNLGDKSHRESNIEKVVQKEGYKPFIKINTLNHAYTSSSFVSGDFDGDGDLDLILKLSENSNHPYESYQFRNDGKGNFTLYTLESPERF